jgi:hypothetical protein
MTQSSHVGTINMVLAMICALLCVAHIIAFRDNTQLTAALILLVAGSLLKDQFTSDNDRLNIRHSACFMGRIRQTRIIRPSRINLYSHFRPRLSRTLYGDYNIIIFSNTLTENLCNLSSLAWR